MITEALSNFVSLNQSKAVQHTLLGALEQLHERLIQIEMDIKDNNLSSVSLIQKQLRTTLIQLEAALSTENTNQLNIDDLLAFITAFKTTTSLNSDLIKKGIKSVEVVYLQKSAQVAKKSKGHQRLLKKLSVITLFPALAWLAYTTWLHLGSGFDVVYHEIQWPQDAYENSLLEPNTYQYSAVYQADIDAALANCYIPNTCSNEDLAKAPIWFDTSRPFYKFNKGDSVGNDQTQEYDEGVKDGVVFRSNYYNHQKTIRPINKVSLAVTPLEIYSKGWWLPTLPVDVTSEVSLKLTYDKHVLVNTTGPIFNVSTKVTFTEFANSEEEPQRRSYIYRFYEINSQVLIQDENLVEYKVVEQAEGGLYTDRPIYLDVKKVAKLNAEVVNYEFCFGIEVGDDVPNDHCIAKAYKISNLSVIELLPEVIKRQYHSAQMSYQLLDKSKHTTQLEMSNIEYYIPRSMLLNEYSPPPSEAAMTLAGLLGAVSEVKLPMSPEKGESEIELKLTVDYEESQTHKNTLYLNDYLASGGHVEIYGHIKNLPSGRYKIETAINNEPVHTFTIEYINPEKERYDSEDAKAIWGITNNPNE